MYKLTEVPLYRLFEVEIPNSKEYPNPFTDVNLHATFTSPAGKETPFWGFYDGDGRGGHSGSIWKLRFLPNEAGHWRYSYTWSDGSTGGFGQFYCTEEAAGKGILQPYEKNPRWLAYNGTEPVFLRSYYVGATIISPVEWAIQKVYQPLIEHGYNHIMFNQLLPVEWVHTDAWKDTPSALVKYLFEQNDPLHRMNLDVWKNIEDHLIWLNRKDIGVFVFQGFDGKSEYNHVRWLALTPQEKDFYVRYVCSRLAPLAIIAGWNYTWETEGNGPELELMELISRYDPWNHLRTYEAECPKDNYFENPLYTWAAVENHGYGDTHGAYSHHQATLDGFKGKPVFMLEGNGLWKGFWKATEDSILRAAWAVVTAGGSFIWDWTISNGSEPAFTHEMLDTAAITYMDILYQVMTKEVDFSCMQPHDDLLADIAHTIYCLAEPPNQYLVWIQEGGAFRLQLPSGKFTGIWLDTKNNHRQSVRFENPQYGLIQFSTPDQPTNWVLIIKKQ